jgi:hypothetical protein
MWPHRSAIDDGIWCGASSDLPIAISRIPMSAACPLRHPPLEAQQAPPTLPSKVSLVS